MPKNEQIGSAPSVRSNFCRLCARPIPSDEACMSLDGKRVCACCISETDVEDIIRLCGFESRADILSALGFEYDFA